ncbi:MAG TPA: hypothetical protein VLJ61_19330 [Pyrinomonadaceae bacterium]|nr:hypothetical protein [Pyrinomonadaceae bacterium]
MKRFIAAATACLILILPFSAPAQTRTRRTTSSSAQKRRGTSQQSHLDATRFNAQRLEIAGLSKDLTRFLYLYGRLSKDVELTSAQGGSSDVASKTKAGLVDNVRAMRDRLDQLESHFRFTQGLETQYQTLQGVSAHADEAVQAVSADQYDRAGHILLDIATQLTDTLLEMQ